MPDCAKYALQEKMAFDSQELLEELFLSHGTSTHSFYFEDRCMLWAQRNSVLGYLVDEKKHHAIGWGDPLGRKEDMEGAVDTFNAQCRASGLIPLWMNVNKDVSDVLQRRGYTVLTCEHEDIMNPQVFKEDAKLRQMRARARRHGCHTLKYDTYPNTEVVNQMQDCIANWSNQRSGPQCFSTTIDPFLMKDRVWFIARSTDARVIDGFVTLQRLPAQNGWSMEHCIISPKAPKGTSEELLFSAIENLREEGCNYMTFGISAAADLKVLCGLKGFNAGGLSLLYKTVTSTFKLAGRTKYREKFGVKHVPAYVCLPEGCDWMAAGKAILQTVHADM